MLAQVSENKHLNALFTDLFDPEGAEIYLKPIERYISPGVPVNFYTILESAKRKGETAIGYRLKSFSGDAEHAYGVVINPGKSEKVTFSKDDKLIVIADD
jgi:hypothetical protein